jgi:pimeloyl-ACP methyl ester carboxylesterase
VRWPGLDGLPWNRPDAVRGAILVAEHDVELFATYDLSRQRSDAQRDSTSVHSTRSVIDAGGQRVRATDRLHLAAGLPTLIAWGTADTMIPVEHAHRAHELLPGSELALFTGAGHYPHCDQPQLFLDRLLRFLDHTEPAHPRPGDLSARIAAHTTLD